MNKTHVQVTVRVEYDDPKRNPFALLVDECDFGFNVLRHLNADVMGHCLVEKAEPEQGQGFLTFDLLVYHDDNNLDKVFKSMKVRIFGWPSDLPKVVTVTNYTITDSR